MKNTETLFVRLPAGALERLRAVAKAEGSDMSTVARRFILDALRRREREVREEKKP